VSIWRFNLAHELTATGLAALVLLVGSWFSLDQLERRYLQLHQSDAERVGQLLQEHLLEARQQLDRFAALPPERQQDSPLLLLPAFSDLYRLNPQHQVVGVLKASPGSRVFLGFSFAGSHIYGYLQQRPATATASSVIDRGLEDERASVYFSSPHPAGGQLLARLNLSYLQAFLRRYSQASGLPVLLVSRHGFVMLASDDSLRVPAVDLSLATPGVQPHSPLRYDEQNWLPLVANNSGLGGHIVTLIPADRLEAQRRLVLFPTLLVTGVVLLLLVWKNRRLHQRLFRPVASFSGQIERMRSCVARAEFTPLGGSAASSRFREMAQIEASFEALMQAIRERDLSLQQKLRTSLTAAAIAHEINLPLSTIRFSCQRADQQLAQGELEPHEVHQLVHSLQSESRRVSEVIERMRMLLRNVETTLQPVDLVGVAIGALTRLKRLLQEQQVQLDAEGLEAGPLMVMGDAVQLQMALVNLLRNAIEALAECPPARRQVLLRLRRREGWAVLSVADSGPGFALTTDADTLLRSSKPGGSGLGLFVVRTTLTNHHGRLRIDRSGLLGGAAVAVELPLLPAPGGRSADGLPELLKSADGARSS
jgi:signal transduction histidine kinase